MRLKQRPVSAWIRLGSIEETIFESRGRPSLIRSLMHGAVAHVYLSLALRARGPTPTGPPPPEGDRRRTAARSEDRRPARRPGRRAWAGGDRAPPSYGVARHHGPPQKRRDTPLTVLSRLTRVRGRAADPPPDPTRAPRPAAPAQLQAARPARGSPATAGLRKNSHIPPASPLAPTSQARTPVSAVADRRSHHQNQDRDRGAGHGAGTTPPPIRTVSPSTVRQQNLSKKPCGTL
jgi:hypothetical protein